MQKPTQAQIDAFHKKNNDVFHAATGMSNIQDNALVPQPGLAREMMQKKADADFIKKADKKLKGFKYGVSVGK